MTSHSPQAVGLTVVASDTSTKSLLVRYRAAIALILALVGISFRLLHTVFHKEGVLWEILGELGTFLALIISVHFVYDFLLKNYEHQLFLSTLRSELDKSLEKQTTRLLEESLDALGGGMLQIDYMKVQDNVKEVDIFERAVNEIKKGRESIDIFTSYLLEVDSKKTDAKQARDTYFSTLLSLIKNNNASLRYRRIIQAPANIDLEDTFGEKAQAYLAHIREMIEMGKAGRKVYLKFIDRRRPTTFAIIDNKILLWQINQIGLEAEMQIYGMFVVYDPGRKLIQHFRDEFDDYWDAEAKPVNLKSVIRG